MPLTRTAGFDLLLDSRQSVDFDATGYHFAYNWSCTELVSNQDCFNAETQQHYLTDSPYLIIPSYELTIGIYEFTLVISTPGGIQATATQKVFTNGVGPMIFAQVSVFLGFLIPNT